MVRVDDLLASALAKLPAKPADDGKRADKKRYSELLSEKLALAFAAELRARSMDGARPNPDCGGSSGAERRMAGGIGAKKVDVTWATEESGLILAISIKSINFRDGKTRNYQKNLMNRRGDMLIEAVTLHRRFPYAVVAGVFVLDKGAAEDGTDRRQSTFMNAATRMRIFTGRDDPAGRDEQFERMYLALLDADSDPVSARFFEVGEDEPREVALGAIFDELVNSVALRNPDFYEADAGRLRKA